MAALSVEEIAALDYGYIKGSDILDYCPFQFIQKQLIINPDSLHNSISKAITEIRGKLSTKCDIDAEILKRGSDRNDSIVDVVSLTAIRKFTSNLPGIPDNILKNFVWLDSILKDMRNGNFSLPNAIIANDNIVSKTELIQNSFKAIG